MSKMPDNMSTEPKIWTEEYIESDEGKKRLEEIIRPIHDQVNKDLAVTVNELIVVITKKIVEAYNTCTEMAPTIIKDFGVNPLPDNFKFFVIDHLEELCNKIKLPDSPERTDKFIDSLSGDINAFIEQIKSFTEKTDMDEYLRAYGKLRHRQHYRSEKWSEVYTILIDSKWMNTGTSIEVFNHVMKNKHLPSDAEKIQLLTTTVLAMDLQTVFKFTVSQMNECFRSKNGRSFHEKYRDKHKKSPQDIIKKISDALEA